jgi:hypothetical protein
MFEKAGGAMNQRTMIGVTVVMSALLSLTGCLSVKSYVDPELRKVEYADLLVRSERRPVSVAVQFERNGELKSSVNGHVQERVVKILESSKLFSKVTTGDGQGLDRLQLVLNNVADVDGAVGKGVKTGVTFGAAGSLVTDTYVLKATFLQSGKVAVEKTYRHALHSTIGNAEGPPNLRPMGTQEAFDKVLEDLMLNLILDLQREERL